MLHRILSTIIAAFVCATVSAQGVCVIKGNIADGKGVKKVTLSRTDELGKSVEVATAKVKKGKYTFDILNGSDTLASSILFEVKKKGMSEVSLFDFGG